MEGGEEEDAGKRIPLRNRKKEIIAETVCSTCDYEHLIQYSWYLANGHVQGLVNGKSVKIHRYVKSVLEGVEIPELYVIDHIDNDPLDNRRHKLAVRTSQQNNRNVKKRSNAISIYRGVGYNTRAKKYTAKVRLNNKNYTGYAESEIEAAKLYDAFLLRYVNDFKTSGYSLNFPELESETHNYKFKEPHKQRSIYRYVTLHNSNSKFTSHIYNGPKYVYLGAGTEVECAKMADFYIVSNNLDKKLNFPDDYPTYTRPKKIKTLAEDIDETTVRLIIPTRPDIVVKLDREKYNDISHLSLSRNTHGYITWQHNGKIGMLHRLLMKVIDSLVFVDHRNGDKLDNRLCNLRLATASQNAQNKLKSKNKTSQYHGVSISSERDRYGMPVFIAQVNVSNTYIYAKRFVIEEHAARARDLYIQKNIPNYMHKMNFTWTESDCEAWSAILADKDIEPGSKRPQKRIKRVDVPLHSE